MILFLLLEAVALLIQGVQSNLPDWGWDITANNWIMALIRYMDTLQVFLPITDGLLPILFLWSTFWTFIVAKRVLFIVLDLLRGAGVNP